jgi:hypothetical protein
MSHTAFLDKIDLVVGDLVGPMPERITPEWLESVAAAAEAQCKNGCSILSELYRIKEEYSRAAAWMRMNGKTSVLYVGSIRRNPFKRGDVFKVSKGKTVRRDGKDFVVGRTYSVKVHSVDEGYTDIHHGEIIVSNPRVTWPGTGGLWTHFDLASLDS